MANSSYTQLLKEVREKSAAINSTPLIKRDFISLSKSNTTSYKKENAFRVMQWNLLAQALCQTSDGFILCPNAAMDWSYRQHHIIEELLTYSADIYFIEELDHYHFVEKEMQKIGFSGLFFPKPDSPCLYQAINNGADGCAIFWRNSQFKLLSHDSIILLNDKGMETNQVALLCNFESISGKKLLCAVTHLKSKTGFEEYRFQQGKYLEKVLSEKANGLPVILCGDFNAEPTEKVVKVMKSSKLMLKSAYTNLSLHEDEPPYTTWKVRAGRKGGEKEEVCHTIDYIFYSENSLACTGLLKFPTADEIGKDFLPSYAYPSDHLSLVADFQLL